MRKGLYCISGFHKGERMHRFSESIYGIGRVTAVVISLCAGLLFQSAGALSAAPDRVKELNFVFLHGMGSNSATTQFLADAIEEQAHTYIDSYQQANPGTVIQINTLQRSYPNNVSVDTWANNVADAVKKHFAGKKDLIIIGHSMGGKAALYAVAHNSGNLSAITSMVVTINSPVKKLNDYHVVGGGSVTNYIRANRLLIDAGIAGSVGAYDSTEDGLKVGTQKHWLAFISAESAPLSPEADYSGVDPFPGDMDDGLVPLSAQYSDGADAVYYGFREHSSVRDNSDVTSIIADQILRYLFGGTLITFIQADAGTFEHHAGSLPIIYRWNDSLGESTGDSGIISHKNKSFFRWQEWEDTVGICAPDKLPGSFLTTRTSIPLLTVLEQARWLNPGAPDDCRISIKTRAAPRSTVTVKWAILQYAKLPVGFRDHYEIKVTNGSSLVEMPEASWLTAELDDIRLEARSQAEGPFHWLKGEFIVYSQIGLERKIINEISYKPSD